MSDDRDDECRWYPRTLSELALLEMFRWVRGLANGRVIEHRCWKGDAL